jgi:FdhD protein
MSDAHRYAVQRWDGKAFSLDDDTLADESVVQIALNGTILATLLATNADLEFLALGHVACEYGPAYISHPTSTSCSLKDGVHRVDVQNDGPDINIPRPGLVTSSCGACEANDRSVLVKVGKRVDELDTSLDLGVLLQSLPRLNQHQPLFANTGGVHAAGLVYGLHPEDVVVKEDIGRHNAVDKVFGAHLTRRASERPLALMLSGRCGWDIVAKAARMNIAIVASIGAASHLAAETARACGITLVTFGRDGRGTVIGPVQGRFQAKD